MAINKDEIVKVIVGDVPALQNIGEEDFDTTFDELGVDSLDRSTMFLDLEEAYGVEFTDEDIENYDTINRIVEVINKSA